MIKKMSFIIPIVDCHGDWYTDFPAVYRKVRVTGVGNGGVLLLGFFNKKGRRGYIRLSYIINDIYTRDDG